MQTKLKFIIVAAVLLLSCSTISAASASVYNVTDNSYSKYFNPTGYINNTSIKAGDVLNLQGTIRDKNMFIDRPLSVTSKSKTGKIINGTITIISGGSGSNVTDLKINNSRDELKGILLLNTENNTIKGNIIQSDGAGGHCIDLTRSSHNTILYNNLSEYETAVGWRHSPIILKNSHYNYIINNYVLSSVSNCIYLSFYGDDGGLCYYNNIIGNTCIGVDTSWCYAIQMMGSHNIAKNNTITVSDRVKKTYGKGAYRGISSEMDYEGGNIIIGNTISATYCGIFATSNSIISGNTISNYKDGNTASYSNINGISTGPNCTVTNNTINMSSGYGIYITGSNCTVTGNKITSTSSQESIYLYGAINNITITKNIINSKSMGILLKKQSSSKYPVQNTITHNHITSSSTYAINTTEGTKNTITNNYLISDNGNRIGDDAINSGTGDTVNSNTPAAVTVTPTTGYYKNNIQVTLKINKTGIIYYTLNGTVPTVKSKKYTTPIDITKTTTLKYLSVYPNWDTSPVYTQKYTIDKVAPKASSNIKTGTYKNNQKITLKINEPGTIYYTLNKTVPTVKSKKYTTPINITKAITLKYIAIDKAGNKSPVYTQKYVIDKKRPTASATPPRGSYKNTIKVTLKISEAGTLYYTTNSKTPTIKSTKYSKPFHLSTSKTLKYMAIDKAGNKSPVYTQKYIIKDTTPPKITSTQPINKKTKIPTNQIIKITFSEPIQKSSAYDKITIKNITGKSMVITKSINSNVLTIKLAKGTYKKNTKYTITIPTKAIKDLRKNNLKITHKTTFTTGRS